MKEQVQKALDNIWKHYLKKCDEYDWCYKHNMKFEAMGLQMERDGLIKALNFIEKETGIMHTPTDSK